MNINCRSVCLQTHTHDMFHQMCKVFVFICLSVMYVYVFLGREIHKYMDAYISLERDIYTRKHTETCTHDLYTHAQTEIYTHAHIAYMYAHEYVDNRIERAGEGEREREQASEIESERARGEREREERETIQREN